MKRLKTLALTLADRTNPIVVKELRQAVQSRVVNSILLLFLLANVVLVSGYLVTHDDAANNSRTGQTVFGLLYGVLMVTRMGFVPLYAGIRLAMERNDTNIDLLFITTISPARIVRGKFLSAIALAILIYSACMPFLTFTYLMRGIDLPSIFFALTYGMIVTSGIIILAIFIGSVPGGSLLRLLLALGFVYVLYLAITTTIDFGIMAGQHGISSLFNSRGGWEPLVMTMLVGLGAWGLCYLLAVAALSAKTSNRMFPVRVYLTAVWILFGVGMFLLGLEYSTPEPVLIWSAISAGLFSGILVFILCERENWTPRVRRWIPRFAPSRFVAWLFFTGSAGGVAWCASIVVSSLLLGWLEVTLLLFFHTRAYTAQLSTLALMLGMFLFAWNYSMSGLFVRRLFLPKTTPVVGCVISILLCVIGATFPYFAYYFLTGSQQRFGRPPIWIQMFNPAAFSDSFYGREDADVPYMFLFLWAFAGLIANLPWFARQWHGFERHERKSLLAAPSPDAILPENNG